MGGALEVNGKAFFDMALVEIELVDVVVNPNDADTFTLPPASELAVVDVVVVRLTDDALDD